MPVMRPLQQQAVCCIIFVVCIVALAEDLHCIDKTTRQIAIAADSSNAHKVITHARGQSGYSPGLVCRWNLRLVQPSAPLQLALNVTSVDFDFTGATSAATEYCITGAADVFQIEVNGYMTIGTNWLRYLNWCSNAMALQVGELIVLPMWDQSNNITVEFNADSYQQRNDSRGLAMEAWTMKAGYCERQLLYHAGWCYFVTARRLNHSEAWAASRYAVGELVAFADASELASLLQANNERKSLYPFTSPLDFSLGDVWLGNYVTEGEVYANSLQTDCTRQKVAGFDVIRPPTDVASAKSPSPRSACFLTLTSAAAAAAAAAAATGQARLNCQSAGTRLRALVRFRLLEPPFATAAAAAAAGTANPRGGKPRYAIRETFTDASCPEPREIGGDSPAGLTKIQLILICAACLLGIVILLVASVCLFGLRRRRRRRQPEDHGGATNAAPDDAAATVGIDIADFDCGCVSGRSSGRRSWRHGRSTPRHGGCAEAAAAAATAGDKGQHRASSEKAPLKS